MFPKQIRIFNLIFKCKNIKKLIKNYLNTNNIPMGVIGTL